ncbi:MAG: hypothetical protein QOH73_1032 [Gaiellaceae bacterium]|nr:hypothetical protein [Gaiellaceae bacterium]
MSAPLEASVIICTRDRPRLTRETVQSILDGDGVPSEILVVDQSDELDQQLAALPAPVRYLHPGGAGLSIARNIGVREAAHDVLVFADDDVRVSPGWLAAHLRALDAAGERAAVTGPVLPDEQDARPGAFAPSTVARGEPAVFAGRLRKDVFAGGNSTLRRSAIAEVGEFDPRLGAGAHFPAADDNDMGYRLLEAGYRIVFEPDAFLYHRVWRPKGHYVRLRWRYGRGKGGFYAKHLRLRDPHMLRRLGADIGHRLARLPRAHRARRQALGDLAYCAGIVVGTLDWLARERARGR